MLPYLTQSYTRMRGGLGEENGNPMVDCLKRIVEYFVPKTKVCVDSTLTAIETSANHKLTGFSIHKCQQSRLLMSTRKKATLLTLQCCPNTTYDRTWGPRVQRDHR